MAGIGAVIVYRKRRILFNLEFYIKSRIPLFSKHCSKNSGVPSGDYFFHHVFNVFDGVRSIDSSIS